jgi:hypothetical protein
MPLLLAFGTSTRAAPARPRQLGRVRDDPDTEAHRHVRTHAA